MAAGRPLPLWAVTFSVQVAASGATPTTVTSGGVVTVKGGPYTTANIPGPAQDPADFYGIVVVFAAIFLAILAARWLFGRKGTSAGRGG